MTLKKWMKLYNVSPASIAKITGKHVSVVYRYIDGLSMPKQDVLLKIFIETRGIVAPNDFFGATNTFLEKEIEQREEENHEWILPPDAFRH